MMTRKTVRRFKSRLIQLSLRRSLIRQIRKLTREGNFRLPHLVAVETTNYCNLQCSFCRNSKQKRKRGMMSIDLFKKIINQCVYYGVEAAELSGFGEPILDKRLPEEIKFAKARGIKHILIYTNASLLNPQIGRDLIIAGLDEIHMSVNGLDKESYLSMARTDIDYELIRNNIISFMNIRKRLKKTKPRIYLNAGLSEREQLADKTNHQKQWRDYVDEILYPPIIHWAQEGIKGENQILLCHSLWRTMSICWDGRVRLCCVDYDADIILGDMNESNILDIWNCNKLNDIRQTHLRRKEKKVFFCDTCYETRHIDNWRLVKGIVI